jgi:hypothetical protein
MISGLDHHFQHKHHHLDVSIVAHWIVQNRPQSVYEGRGLGPEVPNDHPSPRNRVLVQHIQQNWWLCHDHTRKRGQTRLHFSVEYLRI